MKTCHEGAPNELDVQCVPAISCFCLVSLGLLKKSGREANNAATDFFDSIYWLL